MGRQQQEKASRDQEQAGAPSWKTRSSQTLQFIRIACGEFFKYRVWRPTPYLLGQNAQGVELGNLYFFFLISVSNDCQISEQLP